MIDEPGNDCPDFRRSSPAALPPRIFQRGHDLQLEALAFRGQPDIENVGDRRCQIGKSFADADIGPAIGLFGP